MSPAQRSATARSSRARVAVLRRLCSRARRSRNATVMASVLVSPVSRASWLASRHASSFLMFRPIVSPGQTVPDHYYHAGGRSRGQSVRAHLAGVRVGRLLIRPLRPRAAWPPTGAWPAWGCHPVAVPDGDRPSMNAAADRTVSRLDVASAYSTNTCLSWTGAGTKLAWEGGCSPQADDPTRAVPGLRATVFLHRGSVACESRLFRDPGRPAAVPGGSPASRQRRRGGGRRKRTLRSGLRKR